MAHTSDFYRPPHSSLFRLFPLIIAFPILPAFFALSLAPELGSTVTAEDHVRLMNGTSRGSDRPARISEIHVLGKTNETLLIGWKKPRTDNSADLITTQYQMNLRNSDNELVSDQSIEVDTSPAKRRNNYMYIFVNLQPGSRYLFQVRACSAAGCGNWSEPPLEAQTADGHPDAPADVQAYCVLDQERQVNNVTVTWTTPGKARGVIVGYNVSLEGHSVFTNEMNEEIVDHVREWHVTTGNWTHNHKYEGHLLFNTNYTIRVCTLNRAGCGSFSHITAMTMCSTPASLPTSLAANGDLLLSLANPRDPACRQVRAIFPRVSARNGNIKCYKLVMIRLPRSSEEGSGVQKLPRDPRNMNISSYEEVHSDLLFEHSSQRLSSPAAYIPEEFPADRLVTDVIVGDDKFSRCTDEEYRISRGIKPDQNPLAAFTLKPAATIPVFNSPASQPSITDGVLAPSTNYTAFIEVNVIGLNGQVLKKRSDYFPLVQTGDLISTRVDKETDTVNSLSPFAPFLTQMTESPNAIFFGVTSGLLLVLCLLVFVLCFLKKKVAESTAGSDTNSEDDQTHGVTPTLKRSGSIVAGQNGSHVSPSGNTATSATISSACHPKWIGQPIFTHSLAHVFTERHADNDLLFQTEFEALPEIFADRTSIAADLLENATKNRYPDVKSYDQTRVRLPLMDGMLGSDYINADFVEGYRGRKLFICGQGPLPNTVPDFWRMIYEHKVSVIVMLTGIEEQGKIKCTQYWNENEEEDFLVSDLYSVRLQSKRCFSDFVIRRLVLRSQDSPQDERHILQFHFLLWKDFLAPEQPSWLLRFIRRVNEYYCPDKGPLLVHCSAGVGRTGTFVAIDSLIPDVTESDFVNIWECVAHLRSQRNFLVQSLKQYIFVYRAILEYSQFGDTDVELRHLSDHYKQLREQRFAPEFDGLTAEFDRLNAVIEDTKSTCVGSLAINMAKNRFEFIIPYDINRVILSPHSPEESTYINASFVQGYDRFLSFIVTQDPLESTQSEFWRMISEQSISAIVMMSDFGPGLMNCPMYWPQSDQSYDYIVVHLDSEESETDCYIKRTFTVRNEKTGQSIVSTQYQFLGWQNTIIPESTLSFMHFVVRVLESSSMQDTPICVHCASGTERCAVFVTLASLCRQMMLEERVDVFQTARYTRSQRTLMLQEPVQYDFLYRSLIDYVTSRNLCDMADTQL